MFKLRLCLGLMLVAGSVACSPAPADLPGGYGWKATSADGLRSIVIVPTLHVGLENPGDLPAWLKAAINNAQTIAIEHDASTAQALEKFSLCRFDAPATATQRPSDALRALLASVPGIDESFVADISTKEVMLAYINRTQLERTKLRSEYSVDRVLLSHAQTLKKKIIELEDICQVMQLLTRPEQFEDQAMTRAIAQLKDLSGDRIARLAMVAWKTGNATALNQILIDDWQKSGLSEKGEYPIYARNPKLADALSKATMNESTHHIVAFIGAFHMFGSASLQESLKALGFTVTELSPAR
jgi:uncharacterized protein